MLVHVEIDDANTTTFSLIATSPADLSRSVGAGNDIPGCWVNCDPFNELKAFILRPKLLGFFWKVGVSIIVRIRVECTGIPHHVNA